MAKPAKETIVKGSYTGFGVDLHQSSKKPLFALGAETCGYIQDDAENATPTSIKHTAMPTARYVYGFLGREAGGKQIAAPAGLYGRYFPQDSKVEISGSDIAYDRVPNDNVMTVCYVNASEYAWFLILNSDSLQPLNPQP